MRETPWRVFEFELAYWMAGWVDIAPLVKPIWELTTPYLFCRLVLCKQPVKQNPTHPPSGRVRAGRFAAPGFSLFLKQILRYNASFAKPPSILACFNMAVFTKTPVIHCIKALNALKDAQETVTTLQRKIHLCNPFLGIARPQSQYPHPVSVSNLYIPRIGQHISLQQNRQTDPGYMWISHRYIYECRNWETEH
jgi:hypothetical protein